MKTRIIWPMDNNKISPRRGSSPVARKGRKGAAAGKSVCSYEKIMVSKPMFRTRIGFHAGLDPAF